MKYLLGVAASVCILAGCANTSDQQAGLACTDRDWEAFGEQSAKAGEGVRVIDRYKNNCAGFGEEDLDAYLDGYSRGLVAFCNFENGYEQGLKNQKMSDICPYEIQENYVKGYRAGHAEYAREQQEFKRLQQDSEQRNEAEHRQWREQQDANSRM